VISPTQRPVRYNTQHSHETTIQAPRGIRIRNPSKTTTTDARLKPHGHWGCPSYNLFAVDN